MKKLSTENPSVYWFAAYSAFAWILDWIVVVVFVIITITGTAYRKQQQRGNTQRSERTSLKQSCHKFSSHRTS
jgi:heme/copper-type cytochrome/quinol oxidase subunit 2